MIWFRRVLTNNILMSLLAMALLCAGVVVSVLAESFGWLNRFGSLVICAGVIILARPAIVGKDVKDHIFMESGFSFLDRRHYKATGEDVPGFVLEDEKSRMAVGWLGPLVVFVGTLTNGFGDLLNKVFGYEA